LPVKASSTRHILFLNTRVLSATRALDGSCSS
jgi:hypothetical protein